MEYLNEFIKVAPKNYTYDPEDLDGRLEFHISETSKTTPPKYVEILGIENIRCIRYSFAYTASNKHYYHGRFYVKPNGGQWILDYMTRATLVIKEKTQ
jgi:hypothetical protein